MKSILVLVLSLVFVFGLTACSISRTDNPKPSSINSSDDTHSTTPNETNSESNISME